MKNDYNPCGSFRMDSDAQGVESPDCLINGSESLRVVDASIMQQATAGDLNARTIMLAERAADIIAGKPMLTADTAMLPVDPNWETCQRSAQISLDLSQQVQSSADVFEREKRYPD